MKKLDGKTLDIYRKNIEKIGDLFPEVVVDGKIDFEILMAILDSNYEESNEKYQFSWNGKTKTIKFTQTPSSGTLLPQKSKSTNWDTTQNLYIEGDNVEVLKLLQKTYTNKIKMIYIDPPYNTGVDFIYKDDFHDNLVNYKKVTEQINRANAETNGRFHTDWLNMIYSRLKLAKNLLTNDGVIFISIDDNECSNLKKICDEIFGESNFVGQFIWQNKKGGGNDSIHIAVEHEYVIVYASNKDELEAFYESYDEEYLKRYKEKDEIGRYFWDTFKRKSGKQYYPITCPDGTVLQYDSDGNAISWLRSKERFDSDIKNGEIRIININGKWSVQFKQRMPEGKKPRSIMQINHVISDKGTTSSGSDDVYELFKKDVFSNPKPVNLIKYFLEFGMNGFENQIVMDFFSGSGTIAEAVMSANAEDGGNRRYIAVQLDEKITLPENTTSSNAKRINENAISVLNELGVDYVITNLAQERIRRAGQKIYNELKAKYKEAGLLVDDCIDPDNLDFGFKVFKLESTNIKPWDASYKIDEQTIFNFTDTIKEDRSNLDVAYEIMLKYGIFNMPLVEVQINNKTMFNIGEGFMIVCLDDEITIEDVTEIAKQKPHCVVFKEEGFEDDNVKMNATYTLERMGVEDVKCI